MYTVHAGDLFNWMNNQWDEKFCLNKYRIGQGCGNVWFYIDFVSGDI